MTYIRSLVLNFLAVFFIDRVAPGIAVSYTNAPNIGADLLFAAIVGFLNASVYPFYSLMEIYPTKMQLAIITGVISFGSFALIANVSFGIDVDAPGAMIGGALIWLVSYLTNYLELRQNIENMKK